ncbi:MAG: peptide ABC transporter substrate-binding protein [Planctomycetia bacterium]|nr:peptide ABC transporter substrate-binding protein [Planctomycetia bacterium]
MYRPGRTLFPYLALAAVGLALVWSTTFSTLPQADFTFINGTELKSIDPARVTGVPEGRIVGALLEGLYRPDPKTLQPLPGMAVQHDLSSDRKTYTFHLRSNALWSDGTRVTAEDFRWSWQRMLHPETGSEYASLLGECVVGADQYHRGAVKVGNRVEIELEDRPNPAEPFPTGTILRSKVLAIDKPPEPKIPKGTSEDDEDKIKDAWKAKWQYTVEIDGQRQKYCKQPPAGDAQIKKCRQVLLDFSEVGIKAPDPATFEVTLLNPTPYFIYLAQFFPLCPVQRACVEKYGYPNWTKAGNIVTNGAYRLEFRRFRDRIRMRKSSNYWDAEHVQINVADALAVESPATGLNMYLDNQVEWTEAPPSAVIPELENRIDYLAKPSLAIYFYRMNVTQKPLDNMLVRRALNLAVNKESLCKNLLRAGQQPALSFVPPGLPGYEPASAGEYNIDKAQDLLRQAGFPGGQGLDRIEILFNGDGGDHRDIAQKIGSDWEKNLGVRVGYKGIEWNSYLAAVRQLSYSVSRNGWTGDYPDPNTFLGLFVSNGEQNSTGWKNPRYDQLIADAAREVDAKKRLQMFHDAERILMDEMPVLPVYSYVSVNMVKPYVKGFYPNAQDLHPLRDLSIDAAERRKYFQAKGTP